MISNGTECWIGGLLLIVLTIAMHSITLVYIALSLTSLHNRVVRANFSHRSTVWCAILIVAVTGAILAVLHGTEMAVWAITYLSIDAMGSWTDAMLFSIDSMTTRGASGLKVAEEWRLMGALEATDGMLLFGISTAFLFAVLQQISPMLTGVDSTNGPEVEKRHARNRSPAPFDRLPTREGRVDHPDSQV